MAKLIRDYILVLVGFIFIVASPALLYGRHDPLMPGMERENTLGFHIIDYIQQVEEIIRKLFQKETWLHNQSVIKVPRAEGFSLFEILPQRLFYSFEILAYSLLIAISIAFIFSLLIQLSPRAIKRVASHVLFLLGSLPDIFYIIALQVFVIYFFKRTGILLVQIAVFKEKIYLAPILCLTIIPTVYLIRMLLLHLEEESEKEYSEFAKSKGLARVYIMIIHNLRNALNSLANRTKIIAAFMLSNLFIIETLFNIDGIMPLLVRTSGVDQFIILSAIFTTIYFCLFIITFFKLIYQKFLKREGRIHENIV